MSNLSIQNRDGVLVVDSRLIAQDLEIEHRALLQTLDKYLEKIEASFGTVAFEMREFKTKQGNRSTERIAYLTEDQSTLLMTFSRNTERVVDCKIALVQAFSKAKQVIKQTAHTAQSQSAELKKLELQLIQAKQLYQDTGHAISLSTSPAMLAWLRGDAPPPVKVEYKDRFIDARTGKEVGSTSGRSLTQLIADAGLNPKSKRDCYRVKVALKHCGMDFDQMEGWSKASYLREYPVLEEAEYERVLRAVLDEIAAGGLQPNLFVHQIQQQAAFTPRTAAQELQGVER